MNLSAMQIEILLKVAGKKLGMNPEILKEKISSGDLSGLPVPDGVDGKNFDREKLEKLIADPKAQEMIKKFIK